MHSRDNSTFFFLIGPEAKKYPIYSPILAPLSPALSAMVSSTAFGTPCTFLPDCDTATFDRFVEFLHTGDFASPLFVPVRRNGRPQRYIKRFLPPVPLDESPSLRRAFDLFATAPQFAAPPGTTLRYDNHWKHTMDDTQTLALSAVAKVYLLADRYGVDRLKALCLHKIHRLIVCVREICDGLHFLRLCEAKGFPHPLYKLGLMYCLFHYCDLQPRADFASFAEDAPGFVKLVTDKIAGHMIEDAEMMG